MCQSTLCHIASKLYIFKIRDLFIYDHTTEGILALGISFEKIKKYVSSTIFLFFGTILAELYRMCILMCGETIQV